MTLSLTAPLREGYVDSISDGGTADNKAILSMHGMFGGYDQGYDTCKDFSNDYRIIAPSRFGYLGSDVMGDGTPSEQAAAYVELLDQLGIDKVYPLATSAGGTAAIRFALDYPERTNGLIPLKTCKFQRLSPTQRTIKWQDIQTLKRLHHAFPTAPLFPLKQVDI